MAKIMDYTIPSMGLTVTGSYWIPTHIQYDKLDHSLNIVMTGYRDAESRKNNEFIIDSKSYNVRGAEADNFMNTAINSSKNIVECAYDFVSAKIEKTISGTNNLGQEFVQNQSFFYGASDDITIGGNYINIFSEYYPEQNINIIFQGPKATTIEMPDMAAEQTPLSESNIPPSQ